MNLGSRVWAVEAVGNWRRAGSQRAGGSLQRWRGGGCRGAERKAEQVVRLGLQLGAVGFPRGSTPLSLLLSTWPLV